MEAVKFWNNVTYLPDNISRNLHFHAQYLDSSCVYSDSDSDSDSGRFFVSEIIAP